MPLVLFNIGWMRRYRGQTGTDRIVNGGQYIRDNETGGEIRNFLPAGRHLYGYVQPPGDGMNLERLGAVDGADHTDGVTIVFTATRPEGGRVVVGWYRNARVWRDQQRRGDRIYFARALREDCTLLDVEERVLSVPSAGRPSGTWGMGQSNVRYVDQQDEDQEFIQALLQYMESPADFDVAAGVEGAPRQLDPARRARVERAAVDCVIAHYEAHGFECDSVEADNKGWDLEVTRGAVRLLVEVKGCSGDSRQVELTPNEYAAMSHPRYREMYRLAVVTRALEEQQRRLSTVRYNGSDDTWRDQDGRLARVKELTGARIGLGGTG